MNFITDLYDSWRATKHYQTQWLSVHPRLSQIHSELDGGAREHLAACASYLFLLAVYWPHKGPKSNP